MGLSNRTAVREPKRCKARGMTARRVRTKVLIDTFVQWLRLRASGLITSSDTGLIQICFSRLRHSIFFKASGVHFEAHIQGGP